ncbi:unnamed protein product [Linum trigynum]
MLREPPARAACSGEYGNALRHWLSFSYSDVGFAGHDQVSPQIHYLTSTSGAHYYVDLYHRERALGAVPFYGVSRTKRHLDREANEATVLAEPVLPRAPPDLGVPCGTWQYLFNECNKKHGDLVAAKCEYQRCKLYECNANYYKNNAAADDGV